MTSQDRYIAGVPCWIDTSQPDPGAAADFYGELFGWEIEDTAPADAPGRYLVGRLPGGDVAAIGSQPAHPSIGTAWTTYIWVTSADETTEKARAAGGTVLLEPTDVGGAGRMAALADTEGAAFCVWEPRGHRGAAVVNEHGSLNFNDLRTRDAEAAKAFYGAVFGWEAIEMGGGSSFWALPAYGDFLEQRTPGMRAGMADMGAPPRFEETVASLVALTDDDPGARPHWGVTFAVDDADAIAERALELGGRVDVAPFDAPWVRMTVITDPQGATFTASKFVPENKDLAQPVDSAVGA